MQLRRGHRRTLELIYARPVSGSVPWRDGDISERAGSRVAVVLFGEIRVFQRPHPSPNTDKGGVAAIRQWLEDHGVQP